MDDAWLNALTSSQAQHREKPQAKRRPSLLQQPAEAKTDIARIEPIQEVLENDENAWNGPPKAMPARRAQSYADFYHAVRAYSKRSLVIQPKQSLDSLRNIRPCESFELDFDNEFGALEERLLEESHAGYQTYQEQLQFCDSHLDGLLDSTANALELLSELSYSFKAVHSQTEAFREQCESLVAEQRRLTTLADAIDENVQYFAYLEPMTRRLNAPGAGNLVKGKDFPEMLSNLDNCLAYMESHPKHRESATYRSRYRLLLTRALTLIRQYFTKCLGEMASDISKRIQAGQLKDTTHSALLYAKFRVPAPELKSLGLEIQKRAVPTPDDVDAGREPEYLGLLRELYSSYSTTRGRLVLPLGARKMAEIAASPQHSDVVAFAKASIGFMRGICLDEHELWFEWFETEGALYELLESLMEPMYDYLRPKTIHETKLEKLCDLCAMIQGRYMDMDSEDEDEVEAAVMATHANGRSATRRLDFATLVHPALEDAQTRLVFLAMNVLRDSIEHYRPKSEDLEWPKPSGTTSTNGARKGPVLSGRRDRSMPVVPAHKNTVPEDDIDDGESMFSKRLMTDDSNLSQRQWYPTLRKAIWLLRRIYRLVNSTVFDDLAHRIVHSTIASLLTAGQQVTSLKSKPDGRLFLITHLLHLKQQIVAFDIELSVTPEVGFDFSSVTDTFYELRERGSLWNPASWVRLVGGAVVGGGLLPKVVENMLDAKAELDGRLRTVINDFVNGYAAHIAAPVDSEALARATRAKETFDATKAVRTVRGLAEKDVPILRAKLEAYVDDARTRETLVAAVRDQVVMLYEEFFDSYAEDRGKKVSRKGKAREDEIWGPDIFIDTMERVFQVGNVIGDEEGSEGSGHISD